MEITKGVQVRVIAGDDKGKTGEVIAIQRDKHRVKVRGVGIAKKHHKARRQGEESRIKEQERYIDISNVQKVG